MHQYNQRFVDDAYDHLQDGILKVVIWEFYDNGPTNPSDWGVEVEGANPSDGGASDDEGPQVNYDKDTAPSKDNNAPAVNLDKDKEKFKLSLLETILVFMSLT